MLEEKPPALSVVIVNYKTPALCIDCLASLSVIAEIDLEIIVVDNASMDDSLAQIDQAITDNNWTSVTLVGSPDNGGFSSGNNIGISISRGDLILLLNSDTIVSAGAFELLVQTMLDNPRGRDGQPEIGMD